MSQTTNKKSKASFVLCSIVFSLWPDLDLVYHYFFDTEGAFHHTYFPHLPIVMLIGFLVILPLAALKRFENYRAYYYLFFANWMVHLILDTFTGGIMWFYPLSDKLILFIEIPAVFQNWIISFIFHWSFILELAIIAGAVVLFSKGRKRRHSELKPKLFEKVF